jgi:hypothetical protein
MLDHFEVIRLMRHLFILKLRQRFMLGNQNFCMRWLVRLLAHLLLRNASVYLIPIVFGGKAEIIIKIKLHWFLYPSLFLRLFE